MKKKESGVGSRESGVGSREPGFSRELTPELAEAESQEWKSPRFVLY